ncbi:OLC1v1036289C1 [Oldenlandia corymbosa var. corymbosa]|uniref:OLC1v1036289C1 n=1 Tax=Oldenlandia corymbosa var. corymbosa TaxID=529605 RepID=A0AAV1CYF9_OLDCO|nr:OLC1v1036289C1 [Oldenlandia corymbosa var. corymbosa]
MEVESCTRNSPADDQTPILRPDGGGYNHNPDQDAGNARNQNNSQNYPNQGISTKTVIRKTIPYVIAIAFACLLFYHSPSQMDYYFSKMSSHPLSQWDLSENSSTTTESSHKNCNSSHPEPQGNLSGPEILNVTASPNNASMETTQESSLGFNASSPIQNESGVDTSSALSPVSEDSTEEAKLKQVLNKAATENKTVVVTTVNAAWTEPGSLLDLLLESLKNGNGTQKFINHLVVLSLDQKAYNRCSEIHPHCFAIHTEGIDFSIQEAVFMTPDYVRLVWRKIECMQLVLKLGYNAIFTDADVLWFRDPFLHFLDDADIQTSSDFYGGAPTEGYANTGFYFAKSNNRTIQFFEFWLKSRYTYEHDHDQQVFQTISADPLVEKIGIKIRLLDTAFYGGLCQPSKDLNLVCTMHANCCIGLRGKIIIIRMLLEEWKKYMALSNEEQTDTEYTWPFPVVCG